MVLAVLALENRHTATSTTPQVSSARSNSHSVRLACAESAMTVDLRTDDTTGSWLHNAIDEFKRESKRLELGPVKLSAAGCYGPRRKLASAGLSRPQRCM